jgi:hypothetical protein
MASMTESVRIYETALVLFAGIPVALILFIAAAIRVPSSPLAYANPF